MKALDQFVISFAGLKPGEHRFDLCIDDAFFDHFSEGEIRHGAVDVRLNLVKEERMLVFQFGLSGVVFMPCDRCCEPLDIPVSGSETLIVKMGSPMESGKGKPNDEVEIIPESATQFDTAPFLYETVHLLLPAKRVHPETRDGKSGCNPVILKKLEELSQNTEPDPRWEALKELKIEN